MRELKLSDTFTMSKIVKKMGLKVGDLEFKNKTDRQAGIELILMAFENLFMAETEVMEFLADLKGITIEDLKELPLSELSNIIKELKAKSGFESFLSQAEQ